MDVKCHPDDWQDPNERATVAWLPRDEAFSGLTRTTPGDGWAPVTTVVFPSDEGCDVVWWWTRG